MTSKRFAILIGISEYSHSYWHPLPYIEGDIRGEHGLEGLLKNNLGDGLCFDEVIVPNPKTNNSDLKDLLWKTSVNDKLSTHNLLLVYLSGHGTHHPISGHSCLVVHNTSTKDPESTGIPFSWIFDLVSASPASIILVIDTCFSGNIAVTRAFKDLANIQPKALFASCSSDEKSFATPSGEQSLFTQAFVEGLSGMAALDGQVTTSSLKEYLKLHFRDTQQKPVCIVPTTHILLSVPCIASPACCDQNSLADEKSLTQYGKKLRNELSTLSIFSINGYFVRPQVTAYCIEQSDVDTDDNTEKIKFQRAELRNDDPDSTIHEQYEGPDALDHFNSWMSGTLQLALLLGDTGTGKTTLLQRFWLDAVTKWLDDDSTLVPFLIDLRILADVRLHGRSARYRYSSFEEAQRKFRAVIMDHLQYEGGIKLYWEDIRHLCQQKRALIIFDGLDEMSQDGRRASLITHLKLLNELAKEGARIVISCRTHYLPNDSEYFSAIAEAGLPWQDTLVFDIVPFSAPQINQYVHHRLSDNKKKLWRHMKESGTLGLSELSRRPFLLSCLVDVISNHPRSNKPPRQTHLFQEYLIRWLNRDQWRFKQFLEDFHDTIKRDLQSLNSIELAPDTDPDSDLTLWCEELLTHFIEALAVEMNLEKNKWILPDDIVAFLRTTLPSLPKVFLSFFEYAIRTCTFLTRDFEGQYSFLDDSIKAYFAASGLRREIKRHAYKWDQSETRNRPRIKAIPSSLGPKPLDTEVLTFLSDMFSRGQASIFGELIRKNISRIHKNPNTLRYLAGNCLSVLARLQRNKLTGPFKGLDLSGADLTNVTLKDVDFQTSVFERCNFSYTTFLNVNLMGAKFLQCDFEEADLTKVQINGGAVISRCSGLNTLKGKNEAFSKAVELSAKGERVYEIPMLTNVTKMRILDGGELIMGVSKEQVAWADPWETPAHLVSVRPFAIDIHPVTNAQFKKFIVANPEWGKLATIDRLRNAYYLKTWDDADQYPDLEDDHPVTYVNWFAAKAYSDWVGKRLPTEAEWEFALRDGHHQSHYLYPWGNEDDPPNVYLDLIEQGKTVKWNKAPCSPGFKLFSMCGNVNEWVWDWYKEDYYSYLASKATSNKPEINPKGPRFGSERVFRGGSFLSGNDRNYHELTCFYRKYLLPQNTNQDMGFRCAMDPDACRFAGLEDE